MSSVSTVTTGAASISVISAKDMLGGLKTDQGQLKTVADLANLQFILADALSTMWSEFANYSDQFDASKITHLLTVTPPSMGTPERALHDKAITFAKVLEAAVITYNKAFPECPTKTTKGLSEPELQVVKNERPKYEKEYNTAKQCIPLTEREINSMLSKIGAGGDLDIADIDKINTLTDHALKALYAVSAKHAIAYNMPVDLNPNRSSLIAYSTGYAFGWVSNKVAHISNLSEMMKFAISAAGFISAPAILISATCISKVIENILSKGRTPTKLPLNSYNQLVVGGAILAAVGLYIFGSMYELNRITDHYTGQNFATAASLYFNLLQRQENKELHERLTALAPAPGGPATVTGTGGPATVTGTGGPATVTVPAPGGPAKVTGSSVYL